MLPKTLLQLKTHIYFFSVPPKIDGSDSPKTVSVNVKEEITLECNVQGSPFPIIQWFKNRK